MVFFSLDIELFIDLIRIIPTTLLCGEQQVSIVFDAS
jgi:hypothetical protein